MSKNGTHEQLNGFNSFNKNLVNKGFQRQNVFFGCSKKNFYVPLNNF